MLVGRFRKIAASILAFFAAYTFEFNLTLVFDLVDLSRILYPIFERFDHKRTPFKAFAEGVEIVR